MTTSKKLGPFVGPRDMYESRHLPPKLLILDCDGVLVDSEPIVCRTYWQMVRDAGYTDSLETFMLRFSGVREERILQIIAEQVRRQPAFSANEMRAAAFAALDRELPSGSAFGEIIRQTNIAVCVASNSDTERLQLCVERAGLGDVLGGRVFSADDVAHAKPAPDILFHAANVCGVEPQECFIVEDSVSGVNAAVAFGGRVIGFGYRVLEEEKTLELRSAGVEEIVYQPAEIARFLDMPNHPQSGEGSTN